MSSSLHMSPEEFRFIRVELACTQDEISEMLALTSRQIARFESGASPIGRPVAVLMRMLFLYRTDQEAQAVEMIGDVFYGHHLRRCSAVPTTALAKLTEIPE